MPTAVDILERVAADAWATPAVLPLADWADEHRVIAGVAGSMAGRWSTDFTPYMRGPYAAIDAPGVRVVVLMFGSQLSKTETFNNWFLSIIAQDPAPTLFMLDTRDTARDFNTDRFLPSLEECPVAKRHLRLGREDKKRGVLRFDRMRLWFVGANAPGGRRSRPIKNLGADEIDSYADPEWVEVFERLTSFGDSKTLLASIPSYPDTGIDHFYQRSSRRRCYVPCPRCGAYQVLRWSGIHWDGGLEADPEALAADPSAAWYVCGPDGQRGCGGRIEQHEKRSMLDRCVWVAAGESIDADGRVSGVPASRTVEGFQLSSLYSPFAHVSWGSLAAEFVREGGMTQRFANGRLGETWQPKHRHADAEELRSLCGGYRMGAVPADALILTGEIDVQADGCYVAIRGWSARARKTYLVHHEFVPCGSDGALGELDGWTDRRWDRGGTALRVRGWIIDTGHRTDDTYRLIRRWRERGVAVIGAKGMWGRALVVSHRVSVIDKWTDDTPMPGGAEVLLVNVDYFKPRCLAMLKPEPGHEARCGLPEDVGRDYLRQLCSEGLFERKTPRGSVWEWRMRPGHQDNHYWDMMVYGCALAEYAGLEALEREPVAAAPKRDEPAREDHMDKPSGPWLQRPRGKWMG